tara:strand:- start:18839 stop:19282 length:444 start_codon:yes stop_codon:yes gene_type:complete
LISSIAFDIHVFIAHILDASIIYPFYCACSGIINLEPSFEYGILVSEGEVESEGKVCQQDQLFRFHDSDVANNKSIKLAAKKGTRIMFIGGEPLNNQVLMWWNFVADNKAEIEQSIVDWNNGHERFGNVDSDMKRLPAPELPKGFKG